MWVDFALNKEIKLRYVSFIVKYLPAYNLTIVQSDLKNWTIEA